MDGIFEFLEWFFSLFKKKKKVVNKKFKINDNVIWKFNKEKSYKGKVVNLVDEVTVEVRLDNKELKILNIESLNEDIQEKENRAIDALIALTMRSAKEEVTEEEVKEFLSKDIELSKEHKEALDKIDIEKVIDRYKSHQKKVK